MLKNTIFVSVVMAVYNGEQYLSSAIESILAQSYQNFELIIVDDGSEDTTANIVKSFCDPRIRLIQNQHNMHLASSLNRRIRYAKGKYIIRMDADDLCFVKRFEQQVAYMERHPEVGMSFGSAMKFSDGKIILEFDTNDCRPEYIRATMLFFNTVYHTSAIIRREVFERFHYCSEYTVSEDMELRLRMTEQYTIVRTRPSAFIIFLSDLS